MEHGPLGAGPVSEIPGTEISRLIASMMREVADFPEPGVQFKDLTPLLADASGLAAVTDALAAIAALIGASRGCRCRTTRGVTLGRGAVRRPPRLGRRSVRSAPVARARACRAAAQRTRRELDGILLVSLDDDGVRTELLERPRRHVRLRPELRIEP